MSLAQQFSKKYKQSLTVVLTCRLPFDLIVPGSDFIPDLPIWTFKKEGVEEKRYIYRPDRLHLREELLRSGALSTGTLIGSGPPQTTPGRSQTSLYDENQSLIFSAPSLKKSEAEFKKSIQKNHSRISKANRKPEPLSDTAFQREIERIRWGLSTGFPLEAFAKVGGLLKTVKGDSTRELLCQEVLDSFDAPEAVAEMSAAQALRNEMKALLKSGKDRNAWKVQKIAQKHIGTQVAKQAMLYALLVSGDPAICGLPPEK